jgi:16S rRNA (guanine966-N2)-methyltransferase
MENRRTSPPRKGSGPRPQNRNNRGGSGWVPASERGTTGPRRPGGSGGGGRFGPRPEGTSSRDGYQSRSGGRPGGGRPGDKGRKPTKPWENQPYVKITSDLQITDGKYRGKLLQNSTSPGMAPSKHRLREMLFKLISPRQVRASRFLDICAGSGLVGLEAISRGAMLGTFVDRSARMATWIRKNAEELGIKSGHAEVIESEVLPFLKDMASRRRRWDIVYFCPPTDGTASEMFKYLGRGVTIAPGGTLVIEHPSEMELPEPLGGLIKARNHKMDGRTLSFFTRKPAA